MDTENEQTPKRPRGRPRKYPPKPPKPKLTREELSRIRAEAGRKGALAAIANGTQYRGGRPVGTKGEGYHRSDTIAAGEPREQMSVLASSADVFRRLANAEGKSIIAYVKGVTDGLKAQHPEVFGPSAPSAPRVTV